MTSNLSDVQYSIVYCLLLCHRATLFSRKSLYQLEQEDTTQRKGILVISDNLRLSDVDVNALLKMAERGDKIMLVSTLFGRYLEDTLQFRSYYSYFSPMALKKYATSFMKKDSLHWIGDSTVYPRQTSIFIPSCVPLILGRFTSGKGVGTKSF